MRPTDQPLTRGLALITGASEGIGQAFSTALAEAGTNLLLVARRQDLLEAHAQRLRDRHGVTVTVLPADLSRRDEVERVLLAAREHGVRLAVLAAGRGTSGPFSSASIGTELDMLMLNCAAPLVMTHALAHDFSSLGGGAIVLFSSLVAFQGVPHAAHYAATKAYVQSLVEGLAPELAAKNVRLVACSPGPVASGFAKVAGMTLGPTDHPDRVARETLAALDGSRTTVRPGLVGKLLQWSLGLAPRRLRVWIMGRIMGGMTARQPTHVGAAG